MIRGPINWLVAIALVAILIALVVVSACGGDSCRHVSSGGDSQPTQHCRINR